MWQVGPAFVGVRNCISQSAEGKARLEADARLIAAAPDLLAALEAIKALGGVHEAPTAFKAAWREAMQLASGAITKAKGE
jgi:hypothetical protein